MPIILSLTFKTLFWATTHEADKFLVVTLKNALVHGLRSLTSNQHCGACRALLCLCTSFSCFRPEKSFVSARICWAPGFLQQHSTFDIELVWQEVYLEAADGAPRWFSWSFSTKLGRSVQDSWLEMCVWMLTYLGLSPSWAPPTFPCWLFKRNTFLFHENKFILSSTSLTLFITRATYIHNLEGLLSLHSARTHTLAVNWATLSRMPWRISWTPKSGHTSPSVQPPGMDPVPSGMSSESAALSENPSGVLT